MIHLALCHLPCGQTVLQIYCSPELLLPPPEAAAAAAAAAARELRELRLPPALLLEDLALASTAGRRPCCLIVQAYVISSSAVSANTRKWGPRASAISPGVTGDRHSRTRCAAALATCIIPHAALQASLLGVVPGVCCVSGCICRDTETLRSPATKRLVVDAVLLAGRLLGAAGAVLAQASMCACSARQKVDD